MTFTRDIMLGMPLTYFFFFTFIIVTGNSGIFGVEEGVPTTGMFVKNLSSAFDVTVPSNVSNIDIDSRGRGEAFNESGGILGSVSIGVSGLGYVKQIILLDQALLNLPLDSVVRAKSTHEVIFNNLFWLLFVVPSHVLLPFAILFFIRGLA